MNVMIQVCRYRYPNELEKSVKLEIRKQNV